MTLKKRRVAVTVSRTVQVQQFQPSTVTVTEEADVPDDEVEEAKQELYESAAKSVRKFMKREIKRWED